MVDGLPIGDYALLSDCRSAALVSRAGSVDWLCFRRFDAPAVFCCILDPAGGHFAIRPAGQFTASRAYAGPTMVLETTFGTVAGTGSEPATLHASNSASPHNPELTTRISGMRAWWRYRRIAP